MEDRSHQVLAIAITFLIVTVTAMLLRMYVRLFLIKAVGLDDYMMMVALALYMAFLGCEIGGVRYGTGKHRKDMTDEDAEVALKYWWLCEVFYSPATAMLKVSVGFFLHRVAVERWHIWIINFFMAGSVVFGLLWALISVFQCRPISFWWDLNPDSHGKCLDATVFTICAYIVSVLNSTADFSFAIVPMLIVKDTTMTTNSRILVSILLGVASVACVVTIVRIPFLHTLNVYKGEFLYNTVNVAMLSASEVGLGITAACCATLRPLFQSSETLRTRAYAKKPSMMNPPPGQMQSLSPAGGSFMAADVEAQDDHRKNIGVVTEIVIGEEESV